MAGPATSMEPPRAGLPLTVANSRAVSVSHNTLPLDVEYARRCPSKEPENTTPGIAVTAADCAGEQSVRSAPHGNGFALQTIFPVFRSRAWSPPPFFGSRVRRKPCGTVGSGLPPSPTSEIATYIFSPSDAEPH